MRIKFPEIKSITKFGDKSSKNTISHLIYKENFKNCQLISKKKTSLVLKEDSGIEYFITSRVNIPQKFEYVLLAKRFSDEDLRFEKLELIKWLKNIDIKDYSPDEIVQTWQDAFVFKPERQSDNILGLRKPQLGAVYSVLGHLTNSKEIATVVLPTGTGKTEAMLSLLAANQCSKLLVTVPSDSLRTQLAKKFYDFGLLKEVDKNGMSILKPKARYPIVGILNTGFRNIKELRQFFNKCNVVISTMNLVAASSIEQQQEISLLCSHLFVDEAHHSKAGNWDKFIKTFEKKKVVQFTATPYRNDGKMLDGKIIYNFTLKEAQEQGYFKEIEFIPIREYDRTKSDSKIAETAVRKLREDINQGYDHILMARCDDKKRATEVFKIYKQFNDLSPVLLHSSIKEKNRIKERIVNKEHKIIVCVDMLGEGFDLPELKIAAFHDVRQSLPITLQFAGRFTRTSRDTQLGKASFIANLYQPNINDEIGLLYVKESNWNTILPSLSQKATQEQIDLQEFLSGFENIEESIIPYQDIRPAFSAVVYKNQTNSWAPLNFKNGIKGYDNYDYKFFDLNKNKNTLIIVLGSMKNVDWGNFADVYNIEWDIFIVYWEKNKNTLFIHSSEKGSEFKELAYAIIGENAVLIKDENVFRAFYNIDRVKLYNTGLRRIFGKNITFQAYYGRGVQEALSITEERTGINNNSFGVGFEEGELTSMGCSRKGRIWSYSRGTINEFTSWCDKVSLKLTNPNIDPDKILLRNAIKTQKLSRRPNNLYPLTTDWHYDCFKEPEDRIMFIIGDKQFDLSNSELNIFNPSLDGELQFSFDTESGDKITFQLELSVSSIKGESVYDYKINKTSPNNASIKFGSLTYDNIETFFNEYPPIFWFVDGSYLQGYEYVKFNEDILLYPKDEIISWAWENVSLNKESEKFENFNMDSIQSYCFQKFQSSEYDIIYNDDNSGEIADIVTIKNLEKEIGIELYHLKFAVGGKVSNEIENLFAVCGQAQKSLVWKHRDGEEFIHHLLKREFQKNEKSQTRLKKGKIEDLENLLDVVKRTKPMNLKIYIVQPSISKQNVSDDILNLLGVTANHLKKQGNIDLKIIGSL